ncbi:MAG: glutathione S-transferase family protein [Rhizobiaceae bacterium]|nr:glutathione S-transferase family protein [Rhizobiaceae bacterium]
MSDYTLKSFAESGNAYKAALMLALCKADWQAEWVDFFKGATRADDYRKLNAMGEVPVLVDHTQDDRVLSQTGVILLHLADRHDKFVPGNRADELEMLRWMFFDNHKLTSYVATYRFMSRFMKKEGEPETEFLKGRGMSALKVLDGHLSNRDWIATNQATLADLSCCGYLFWPDHIGVSWDDYPGIKNWLSRIQNLENWQPPEALLPTGPQT